MNWKKPHFVYISGAQAGTETGLRYVYSENLQERHSNYAANTWLREDSTSYHTK